MITTKYLPIRDRLIEILESWDADVALRIRALELLVEIDHERNTNFEAPAAGE